MRRATLEDKHNLAKLSHEELCETLESSKLIDEGRLKFVLVDDVLYSPRTLVELLGTNQVGGV